MLTKDVVSFEQPGPVLDTMPAQQCLNIIGVWTMLSTCCSNMHVHWKIQILLEINSET